MVQSDQTNLNRGMAEFSTFYVGTSLCGMDILKIQEINKLVEITVVPQAPDYIMGILNLRGQIVTIIDLGKKLGLSSTEMSPDTRNIIVTSKGEYIGLLVERISDVVTSDREKVEAPLANIGGVQGKYFTGVYKTANQLIGILDVDAVLGEEN